MQWLKLLALVSVDAVQFPAKAAVFYHSLIGLSTVLYVMCSDQHVEYWMPCGFPLTSSLQLDYHVEQYINKHTPPIKLY